MPLLLLPPLLLLLLLPFNGLFSRTTWLSWYQKGETSLDLNDERDDGVLQCSGISWAICKSAPRSRQITTPSPHHSKVFLQACHPTNSVKALKTPVHHLKKSKTLAYCLSSFFQCYCSHLDLNAPSNSSMGSTRSEHSQHMFQPFSLRDDIQPNFPKWTPLKWITRLSGYHSSGPVQTQCKV